MKMTAAEYRRIAKRPNYRPRKSAEHRIQVESVDWFRLTYPALLLFAIPNGARFGGDKFLASLEWARLEAEGAVPGCADLLLCAASGDLSGLFIEMKAGKKGSQGDTQKEFETLAIRAGYGYALCRSVREFQDTVKRYLESGEY